MVMTTIKAKKNLYNGGKCFTKGKTYTTERDIKTESGLMDVTFINDLGESHVIGGFWRHFEIVYENN